VDEEQSPQSQSSPEKALEGVIVKHRADQAYEMRLSGKSPSEIANALGYVLRG